MSNDVGASTADADRSKTEGEKEKAERWESILRLSKGEICLKWPAGQLLCPHYATWDSGSDGDLKVYVPQGDGKVVTGEGAMRMVSGGLKSDHATLLNRRETPFAERGGQSCHPATNRSGGDADAE